MALKLFAQNILESSTVTVTSENTSYPAYRLYDRLIGFLFKGNSTPANFYITLDQGAVTSYEVDRIIIAAGHNLTGLVLKVQYSTDNFAADNHDADSWTQSGSGLINRAFTAQTKRYWRLNIASPGAAPEIGEMFLTKTYEFTRNPIYGFERGFEENINRIESKSGLVQKTTWGAVRRKFTYELTLLPETDRAAIEALQPYVSGKNFWIETLEADNFFVECRPTFPNLRSKPVTRWDLRLEFLQVLA
jgi:hypothetical protein